VTIKNAAIWDVMPCGSCKNRHFREKYRLQHLSETVNVFSSSLVLFTLGMDAMRSPVTSVFTRATRRNIQEDGILYKLAIQSKQTWAVCNVCGIHFTLR
jgi:transcription elongation factor Elf1